MVRRSLKWMTLALALTTTPAWGAKPRVIQGNRFVQFEETDNPFADENEKPAPKNVDEPLPEEPELPPPPPVERKKPTVVRGPNSTPVTESGTAPAPAPTPEKAPPLVPHVTRWSEPDYPPGYDPYLSSEYCPSGDCCSDRQDWSDWRRARYCNRVPRGFWGRAEFVSFWGKGNDVPALVTDGILPAANTLFGGNGIDREAHIGGRLTLGLWFDDCETRGVETTTFGVDQADTSYFIQSNGNGTPTIARPYNDASQANAPTVNFIAQPGVFDGFIDIQSRSQVFGTEVNYRRAMAMNSCVRWDLLAGYRLFRLDDHLRIHDNSTALAGSILTLGTVLDSQEDIGTRNIFHGGQLGLNMIYTRCRATLDTSVKIGIGNVSETASLNGSTTTTVPGNNGNTVTTNSGAFYVLSSNIGQYNRDRVAVMPELNLNLRYQLNDLWRVNVGYSFTYINRVLRTGNQLDTTIDSTLFPPPTGTGTRPAFTYAETDYWLQGITAGLEARF